MTKPLPRLRTESLRALAGDPIRASKAWMAYRGCNRSSGDKAAERLFTYERIDLGWADRWCCALNTHLALVYPELYEEDAA